jgi:hypothetical protein
MKNLLVKLALTAAPACVLVPLGVGPVWVAWGCTAGALLVWGDGGGRALKALVGMLVIAPLTLPMVLTGLLLPAYSRRMRVDWWRCLRGDLAALGRFLAS